MGRKEWDEECIYEYLHMILQEDEMISRYIAEEDDSLLVRNDLIAKGIY